ncbi:MAG: enoyl-CoA hydratase/isomerase family protein, partial [Deferrisomatales bacterium]
KPVVAAVNGLAMGGGVEVAMRCHGVVATPNAFFQLPEITLGILPGMGGAVVPYRKWPHAAATFHEMIGQARRLSLAEAREIGLVQRVADDFPALIDAAVEEVKRLQGAVPRIQEGPVAIPPFPVPEQPVAGTLALSREALGIVARVVMQGAAAPSLEAALELNYQGSGDISCIEAPKEGVGAFLGKRKAVFTR